MSFMQGKMKLKICDSTGAKLDSATIMSEEDAEKILIRWKKKGLF